MLFKGHVVKSCIVKVFVLSCDLDSYLSMSSGNGLSYNVEIHGKHLIVFFFHIAQREWLQTNWTVGGRYRPHASKSPDAVREQLQSQETHGLAACFTLRGDTWSKTLGWYTFLGLQNSPIVGTWTQSRCAHLWSKKWVLFQEAEVGKDLTPITAQKIARTMEYRYRKRKSAWDRAPGRMIQPILLHWDCKSLCFVILILKLIYH